LKRLLHFAVILIILIYLPSPVFAALYTASNPVYVSTSIPNTSVEQSEILWGVIYPNSSIHNGVLTSGTVRFSIQPGDQVSINFVDSSGNFMSTMSLDTSSSSVTFNAPFGAYGAKLVLNTGSSTGDRAAWWSSGSNSFGNTTTFPPPNIGDVGNGGVGKTDGTDVDLTPVVDELQMIVLKLDSIISKINTSNGSSVDLSGVISAINDQTSEIGSRFDDVTSGLNDIKGQLNTLNSHAVDIKDKLDILDNHVVDIYDYLSTPRSSEPFSVDLPTMTVDPTPPPITEPQQQPYVYNRQSPQMAPFVDSPGPLPLAPDPTTMPHDSPREIDSPVQKDPVSMDSPRTLDPVSMDSPRQPDPIMTQDPVIKEEPRTLDPVSMDAPIQPEPEREIEQPRGRENPLQPDPPLTP